MLFVSRQVRQNIGQAWYFNSKLLGSIINFEWSNGHNVVEVATQEDFDNCTGFTDTTGYEGPLTWPVPEAEGTYYIVCGVGHHCDTGNQKIAVTVGNC